MKKELLTFSLSLLAAAHMFALPPLLGETSYKASSVDNLDFNMSWENLQIKKASGDTIIVEIYCNKKKFAPKVRLSHTTLFIDSVPMHNLLLPVSPKHCTVIVYLPSEKEFENIMIHLSSGTLEETSNISSGTISIEISSGNINTGFLTAKQTKVIASSGAIIMEGLNSPKTLVQASSGKIFLDSIKAKDLVLQTTSGAIKVNSIDSGVTAISSTSGSIKLKDLIAQKFDMTTTSGGISVEGLMADSFGISSTSGTIGLELNGMPAKKSSVASTSGTIFVSLPKNAAATIQAKTASGSFVNAFTKEKINPPVDYRADINGGGTLLSFNANSGRITLDVGKGLADLRELPAQKSNSEDDVVQVDRPIFE